MSKYTSVHTSRDLRFDQIRPGSTCSSLTSLTSMTTAASAWQNVGYIRIHSGAVCVCVSAVYLVATALDASYGRITSAELLGCALQRAHEDGRLLRLPQELASQVWRSLNCISSCHNLIATSKLTQALMGPAVGSVEFTLKGEDNEPFRGLHPSIQPRIITIKAALAEEQSVSEQEYGSYDQSECHVALCSFVPAFVSSPHFRHLEELALKGFNLPPEAHADMPAAFFSNLKALWLQHVAIDGATLAGMLSQCPQLEDLQMYRTFIRGPTEQLSVLSNLATLSLVLDIEEDIPHGAQPLKFLQYLGGCLTSLCVYTGDSLGLTGQLLRVTATHLHRLQHLTIISNDSSTPSAGVFDLLAASPAAQTLGSMKVTLTFPDMKSLVKVLTMPTLQRLEDVTFPRPRREVDAEDVSHIVDDLAGLKCVWPEGKPPMQLWSPRASVTQLAALPLEHFESIVLEELSLRGVTRQERAATLAALMSAAQKCPGGVYFRDFQSHPGDWEIGGLSALQAGCSLKLADDPANLGFIRVQLDESDMKGVAAAYGQELVRLSLLDNSSLTVEAWMAVTPANFPALGELVISSTHWGIVPYLTALCLEWPAEHPLTITLSRVGVYPPDAYAAVSYIPYLLAARGKQNPTIVIS